MATKRVPEKDWKWFGNAGHLCVGHDCRFHLTTQIGDFLVSTVGEYWPDSQVRRIHAQVTDAAWLKDNAHLKGDHWDAAYFQRFGFEEIGLERKFETMVFEAGEPCPCGCGLPQINGSDLDMDCYNDAPSATAGHLKMCRKYSRLATKSGGVK